MSDATEHPLHTAAWGETLVHAESLAAALRAQGIAAIVDPQRLQGVDVNRGGAQLAFPVLVPRERADAAASVLAQLHGAEGDADAAEIERGFLAPFEACESGRPGALVRAWRVGLPLLAAAAAVILGKALGWF
jgi:hypothetical protein